MSESESCGGRTLEFGILGPLEVKVGGHPIEIVGTKRRTALALLVMQARRIVSVEHLIDELWGDNPVKTARNTLHAHIANLRKEFLQGHPDGLNDVLVTRPPGYVLQAAPHAVDRARFESLAMEGRALIDSDPALAAARLREALALWRGPALADVPQGQVLQAEVARLEEQRLAVLEDRIAADLEIGRHTDLVGELTMLVRTHPLRERFHDQLMLALYRSGRQAEALGVYRGAREVLATELGLSPGPTLQAREREILSQDVKLLPPGPSFTSPAVLPARSTPFVGRRSELQELTALLRLPGTRLVTLTGAGGIGKTRLALAAAAQLARDFTDGVYFVPLSGATAPAHVLPVIAETLGLALSSGQIPDDALVRSLATARALIVLDGFEHVYAAAADVAALLSTSRRLVMLVTSRRPLRVAGEHEVPLRPLGTTASAGPGTSAAAPSEAAELFALRARASDPNYPIDDAEVGAVIEEICVQLDGLPLAIELAAARVRLLSPHVMRERLQDRLDWLTHGPRDLPERQRTMRAAIDWSYALLSPSEQALLARLAVFVGGWTVAAAQHVCGQAEGLALPAGCPDPAGRLEASSSDLLDDLEGLLDHSLVDRDESASTPRLRMLRVVREYAEQLLPSHEAATLRRRHAEYYIMLARSLMTELDGPHGPAATAELKAELPNIRAAFDDMLAAGELDLAAEAASGLRPFWVMTGQLSEGRAWLRRLLDRPEVASRSRAWCSSVCGYLAYLQDDYDEATRLFEEALTFFRRTSDTPGIVRSLNFLGVIRQLRGDESGSTALLDEALQLARSYADADLLRHALNCAATNALRRGVLAEADELDQELLRMGMQTGNKRAIVGALVGLSEISTIAGRYDVAINYARQALPLARKIKEYMFLIDLLLALGIASMKVAQVEEAASALKEGLMLALEAGQSREQAMFLKGMAALSALDGAHERAATLSAAGQHLHDRLGTGAHPLSCALDCDLSITRDALAEGSYSVAWVNGWNMEVDEAIRYALV
jgi:predicted ATPase/DNA-binding SARP family transcriptional activator